MKKEQLAIDIVGLAGACLYALDCIEAELVNIKNKHGKRVAYISVRMAEYWAIQSDALQDLAICALLHDNALTQYISEELKNNSDIDLSEEKRISIAFMVRKIFQKFHLKQMFQMSYYITMNMLMERVHFRRHGRKHHYLQELFILLI